MNTSGVFGSDAGAGQLMELKVAGGDMQRRWLGTVDGSELAGGNTGMGPSSNLWLHPRAALLFYVRLESDNNNNDCYHVHRQLIYRANYRRKTRNLDDHAN